MGKAGLLKKNSSEDALLLEEIRQVLDQYPAYGFKRVRAEINRTRSARGLESIGEWRIYKIMNEEGLLKKGGGQVDRSGDALLLEEIRRVLEQHPDYGYQRVTDEINRVRSAQGLKSISTGPIYRLMREAGLQGKGGVQIDRNEDALLLEEIRRVLEQHPDYGYQRVTDEINRVRSAQGLKSISTGPIYRLMREAGLQGKGGKQIDRNEDALLLEEIKRVLDQYPNYGVKKVTDEINRVRSARGLESIGEWRIYKIMGEEGLLKKVGGWISRSEDAEILKEIKRVLDQYPNYGVKKVTDEINRVRSAPGFGEYW